MADRRIDYIALEQIVEWDENPKDHDIPALIASIRRFGFQAPPLLNDQTGVLLAGHGRLHALAQMRDAGEATPDGIGELNGQWLVPVVRGSQLEMQEAVAYSLADNRLVELGGWDEEDLAGLLVELAADAALEGTGWSPEDLDELLRDLGIGISAQEETFDVKAALEKEIEPRIKRGEVWQLGDHRLMCGDSRDAADVGKLVNGHQLSFIFTDPPYGVRYRGGTKTQPALEGDKAPNVYGPVTKLMNHYSVDSVALYLCCAGRHLESIYAALRESGWQLRSDIIWNKNLAQFGALGAQYHQKHEHILYAHKVGCAPSWYGPKNEVTVWDIARASVNEWHPTQKPVGLVERALLNSSKVADVCGDLFLGSGTTIIAAEKLGRICYGMEIEPRYCEVAIQRWEQFTGQKAVKADG